MGKKACTRGARRHGTSPSVSDPDASLPLPLHGPRAAAGCRRSRCRAGATRSQPTARRTATARSRWCRAEAAPARGSSGACFVSSSGRDRGRDGNTRRLLVQGSACVRSCSLRAVVILYRLRSCAGTGVARCVWGLGAPGSYKAEKRIRCYSCAARRRLVTARCARARRLRGTARRRRRAPRRSGLAAGTRAGSPRQPRQTGAPRRRRRRCCRRRRRQASRPAPRAQSGRCPCARGRREQARGGRRPWQPRALAPPGHCRHPSAPIQGPQPPHLSVTSHRLATAAGQPASR